MDTPTTSKLANARGSSTSSQQDYAIAHNTESRPVSHAPRQTTLPSEKVRIIREKLVSQDRVRFGGNRYSSGSWIEKCRYDLSYDIRAILAFLDQGSEDCARLAPSLSQPEKTRLDDLLQAATSAADWLCEARIGTDPYERGIALRLALERLQ